MAGIRRIASVRCERTAVLVCDIQERFRDVIMGFESLVRSSSFLVRSASTLGVPVVVTEQYPKVFKKTVPDVLVPEAKVFEKTRFSMCTDEVKAHLETLECEAVILCGLEAHVCVLQTTLDLLELGIAVHVCADAVSSQREFDRSVALKRLADSGAAISTSESLVFQLVGDAAHPNFKALQPLIKENAAAAAAASALLRW
ncbi:hypothetical protein CTAYLR_001823 [Chrysophaeum taylorii]|uniref:Isochorismatase-like domain-containing protein n=1 Tax=Chrysophaeum taylorii TaxID=2483200 RepID=A0AAD7U8F3_9STRA|nr:hypothetical protein CTAYLR_001823 [Chrysophaeum taylorii]